MPVTRASNAIKNYSEESMKPHAKFRTISQHIVMKFRPGKWWSITIKMSCKNKGGRSLVLQMLSVKKVLFYVKHFC